ncbi:MAG: NAD(P)-dependent oxidoreductase [Planctomycetes bacterium]|nr:NAD(P)-dependent oxidoreductase [Planctomycetota bacterium]
MAETYFLTGALGCIGAWVVKHLVERGNSPVVFDLGKDRRRLEDVISPQDLRRVIFVEGDITDAAAVARAVQDCGAKKIIHLAGLQVPACRANPIAGAQVNVLGTIHLFEAALAVGAHRVVYASSAAVYSLDDAGPDGLPPSESTRTTPTTHYGVYKQANEGNARVYWLERRMSSVGLRPLTVYGVGRDQGMTSDPTRAMKAAVLGRRFHIRFDGATDFLHVSDCAHAFLAAADRSPEGANVYNLHGDSVTVSSIVDRIVAHGPPGTRERITLGGPVLPIPAAMDGSAVIRDLGPLPHTDLDRGVRETMQHFSMLQREGRLSTADLDA